MSFISLAAAVSIAGVPVPATMQVDGQELAVTSCGVRDTLWIEHYVAALYLPHGVSADAVADPRETKAVRLEIIESRYLPANIPEKWREPLEQELARDPMERVRRAYGRLTRGDVVTVTYAPGKGVTMRVNGSAVAHADGHAVIDDVLRTWAGAEPITAKLRELPLNHPCR